MAQPWEATATVPPACCPHDAADGVPHPLVDAAHALAARGLERPRLVVPARLLHGEAQRQLREGHPLERAAVDLHEAVVGDDGQPGRAVDRLRRLVRPLERGGVDGVQRDIREPAGEVFELPVALFAHVAVAVSLKGPPPVALGLRVADQI